MYLFKADAPIDVVRTQLRRRCANLAFPTALKDNRFWKHDEGKYGLSIWQNSTSQKLAITVAQAGYTDLTERLKKEYNLYLEELKKALLDQLKSLTPREFEVFSKRLLIAYGLHNVSVTPFSNDGGIDGTGKWKFGTTDLDVAFQSKRYKKRSVRSKEINEFRGSIMGAVEIGIFFTTAKFTKQAKDASFRKHALPIVLIDGEEISNIMVSHEFGVSKKESFPIYENVLDNILAENV